MSQSNTYAWDTARHLVVQKDPLYLKKLKKNESLPVSTVIENIVSQGFEHHRGFIERLLTPSKPYKKSISSEDFNIISEITGIPIGKVTERIYSNVDDPILKYFREHLTPKMRQSLKILYFTDPQPEDLENWQILIDMKALGNTDFKKDVLKARKANLV